MKHVKTGKTLAALCSVILVVAILLVPTTFAVNAGAAAAAPDSSSSSAAEDTQSGASSSAPPASSSAPAGDSSAPADSSAPDSSTPDDSTSQTGPEDTGAAATPNDTNAALAVAAAVGGNDIKTYFPEGESATIIDNSAGDGMTLQFYDTQGNEILPPENPTINSTVRMGFKLAIPESIRDELKKDDYYVIQLPPEITINAPLNNVPLVDPDTGQPFANFTVGTDGKITIVFTDAVQDYTVRNLKGNLYFSGGLNSVVIGEPGDHDVSIPTETDLPPAHITIQPATNTAVEKDGQFDKEQNPDAITWTVDVNKSLQTLTGATVTDTFPSGLTYVSAEVYPVTVDLNGNVTGVSDTPAANATVNADGTVTFDGTIDSAYRVVYHTTINADARPTSGGNMTFTNNATFTTNELGDLPAQSTLNARYGKTLEKKNAGYDPINQIIHWNINYNYGESTIAKDDAWVDDIMDNDIVVVDTDSVVMRKVTFDAKGNPVLTNEVLKEGVDYEVVYDASGNRTSFRFLHDIDYAVNITYDSKVTGIIDTDIPGVTNTASTGGGTPPSHGSTTIEQQGLIKRVQSVDYDSKTIVWAIDINLNRYNMHNATITDSLQLQADQNLVSGSQKLTDLTDGVDLAQVTDPEQDGYIVDSVTSNLGFNGRLAGKYRETDHSFRITYETVYDVINSDGEGNKTVRNMASIYWTDDDGNGHSSDASATFTPNQPDQDNGKKAGSYNAVTKEITWVVELNYSTAGFQNAYVEDPVLGDQNFIHDSVRVYRYQINPDGTTTRLAELTADEYALLAITEPDDTNNNTLRVDFPDGNELYHIEFRTSLEDEFIGGTYHNEANFVNDLTPDVTLTADVTTKNKGAMGLKTGTQQSDGYAWWTLTINPDQSTLDDVVVTDILSADQIADLDSIVVHGAIVDVDGNLTIDENVTMEKGTDYTVSYTQNPDEGDRWELKVSFLNTMNKAWFLVFRASIYVDTNAGGTVEVTNKATINGNKNGSHTGDIENKTVIDVTAGGGVLIGEHIEFTLSKTDWNGEALAGALFQLFNMNGLAVGNPVRADENGQIVFKNLVSSIYTLREIEAPPGYTISDELANGIILTLTASHNTYTAVNEPTLVSFTKRGDDDVPLAGVQFRLEQQAGDGTWAPVGTGDTYQTGPDGTVEIRGLLPGTYRLVETSTQDGYVIGLPKVFTLTGGAGGRVGPLDVGDIQNDDFYGRLIVHKTDESHFRHLAGATYSLYDGEDELLRDDIVTGADGTATVDQLPVGDYTLVETKGPEGYDIDHKTHAFSIKYDMQAIQVVTLDLTDPLLPDKPYTPETPPGTPPGGTPPTPQTTVPQTGDYGDPAATAVLIVSIVAIAGGAVLWWFTLRRKKNGKAPENTQGGEEG